MANSHDPPGQEKNTAPDGIKRDGVSSMRK
jgi:hypothetical protein